MRSRRRHKLVYHLTYQDSKKILCSKCASNIFSEGVKRISKKPPKKIVHKSLCKNPKCSVHRGPVRFAYRQTGSERVIESSILQKITSGRKFRVTEFEEAKQQHQVEINSAMLYTVEALMLEVSLDEVTFENVLAQGYIKEAISRTVVWPLNKPKIFKGLRAAPRGILLFGPPGVGKSLLGKVIAFRTQASFFNLPASVLTAKWSENNQDFVRALFLVAKARQPSIIFIDEVESLFSHRSLYESDCNRKIRNELFFCMDSSDRNSDDRIVIIAATKKPFDLDEEIILRFSKRFYISLPDKAARKKLLEQLLEYECHSLDKRDIDELADKTDGYTAGEIKHLSREAAMGPMYSVPFENFDNLELAKIKPISIDDFLLALKMIRPSISKEDLRLYENWDSQYGYGGQFARKMGSCNLLVTNNFGQSSYII